MIRVTTVTLISLVGETAMAGAVGAGGIGNVSVAYGFILFKNQIQTTSALPCRTQVQPAASFLVCSLIFIEYKKTKQCIKMIKNPLDDFFRPRDSL